MKLKTPLKLYISWPSRQQNNPSQGTWSLYLQQASFPPAALVEGFVRPAQIGGLHLSTPGHPVHWQRPSPPTLCWTTMPHFSHFWALIVKWLFAWATLSRAGFLCCYFLDCGFCIRCPPPITMSPAEVAHSRVQLYWSCIAHLTNDTE